MKTKLYTVAMFVGLAAASAPATAQCKIEVAKKAHAFDQIDTACKATHRLTEKGKLLFTIAAGMVYAESDNGDACMKEAEAAFMGLMVSPDMIEAAQRRDKKKVMALMCDSTAVYLNALKLDGDNPMVEEQSK